MDIHRYGRNLHIGIDMRHFYIDKDTPQKIDQIRYNLLAISGGRPYIDARLQRAPNESNLSWHGSQTDQIPGRKQRAFLINDAGRVAAKIEQYLFARPVARDGIDEAFAVLKQRIEQ